MSEIVLDGSAALEQNQTEGIEYVRMSVQEAEQKFGISDTTLRKWRNRHKWDAKRHTDGKTYIKIPKSFIEEWDRENPSGSVLLRKDVPAGAEEKQLATLIHTEPLHKLMEKLSEVLENQSKMLETVAKHSEVISNQTEQIQSLNREMENRGNMILRLKEENDQLSAIKEQFAALQKEIEHLKKPWWRFW